MNENDVCTIVGKGLQYLTPNMHREFLECIVECDRQRVTDEITNKTLALSLRCDGSIDRTQIDKIYVMVKVVTKGGEESSTFWTRLNHKRGVLRACVLQ